MANNLTDDEKNLVASSVYALVLEGTGSYWLFRMGAINTRAAIVADTIALQLCIYGDAAQFSLPAKSSRIDQLVSKHAVLIVEDLTAQRLFVRSITAEAAKKSADFLARLERAFKTRAPAVLRLVRSGGSFDLFGELGKMSEL